LNHWYWFLQSLFNPNHNLSFYAGHDYTVLVLLACGRFLTTLPGAIEFGSYVVFELWDSLPGPNSTEAVVSRRGSKGSVAGDGPSSRCGSAKASRKELTTHSDQPVQVVASNRILRVILNSSAFNRNGSSSHVVDGEDCFVCDDRAVVLADMNMTQLSALVSEILVAVEPFGLPGHWKLPEFL
jgi:hypothetical protein